MINQKLFLGLVFAYNNNLSNREMSVYLELQEVPLSVFDLSRRLGTSTSALHNTLSSLKAKKLIYVAGVSEGGRHMYGVVKEEYAQ